MSSLNIFDAGPNIDPEKLWVSASGGRTSMMMARLIQQAFPDHEIPVVFANTGQEHPRTLEFVKECEDHWCMNITWVEAVVHHGERKACTHQIVDYLNADRDGEVFEEVIKKYGLPSKSYPHCTRELKMNPMWNLIRERYGKGMVAAVGIRGDEPRRLGRDKSIVYPMAHWWPHSKSSVLAWWKRQPFDLNLEEREGNCLWCWQKSDPKHAANLRRNPEWYDFPRRMESKYAHIKAPTKPRDIFRGSRSTLDLIETVSLDAGVLV